MGNHADHLCCCSPLFPLSEENPMPAANKAEIVLWGAEQVGKTCRRRWEMMGRYGDECSDAIWRPSRWSWWKDSFLVNKVIAVLGEFSAVPWRARSAPSVLRFLELSQFGKLNPSKSPGLSVPIQRYFNCYFGVFSIFETLVRATWWHFFLKSSVWMCRGGNPSHQQGMDETVSDRCSRRV